MSKEIENIGLELNFSIQCDTSLENFEQSLRIYINKPQVLNKWTAGSIKIDRIEDNSIEYREFLAKSDKIFQSITYKITHSPKYLFLFEPTGILTEPGKYCSYNRPYAIAYDTNLKQIQLYLEPNINDDWLKHTLLKRIVHWCETIDANDETNCELSTLKLYPNMLSDYMTLYKTLKAKYWLKLSSDWERLTNTDPEKFIHEDISIATYLILAWKHLNCCVEQFVDLGCGNGLLVYILRNEGYMGYGVDLRKRKIWDLYECNYLKEKAVNPEYDSFDDCDWLIGNHSDELSPWLPLIANRSKSRLCNLFLIPCCLFDFNKKFDVKIKNESRYDTYVKYLEKVFSFSGFDVIKDKLRIPSTKNYCLIGLKNEKKEIQEDKLAQLMNKGEFKIRDFNEEKQKSSRNCTKNVSNDIKRLIITKVLNELLHLTNAKWIGTWNSGGELNINEAVKLFDQEILVKLKQECGGLKTLLKNHHQMFEFSYNLIKLKIPTKQEAKHNQNYKTKDCLFDTYHPNGCPLNDSDCNFRHNFK